ncbi:DinB family protein [Aeromicrobium sp. CFBP 8757]|uniref:DinB family protein n=1 Tax=Aeromicrobium sp. CFBP 8757 TaxID=2775288 RepID=UPI001785B268|nr:DinB family protein [Aeromicrobium sp. CFBP 8757]MBD8607970.1 DinB family protein [Aeromicrobium sp. CFBP 8757]
MDIEPDTKDWTWVLERPCPACGFDAAQVDPTAVADRVLDVLPRWRHVLGRVEARERPAPATWSPLEYACHVRDVFVVFDRRVRLMLDGDDPEFENWDQDVTAIQDDYAVQLPSEVASQLDVAGRAVAETFAAVPDDAWSRTGRRGNGSVFTVATLSTYFLHDVVHHLHDVHG